MTGIIVECDLRSKFGPVRDQGERPTCMAFATSDAHAAVRPDWIPLSCEYAYYYALERDGSCPHEGATATSMLAVIKDEGQPPETEWEYLTKTPTDLTSWKPPENAGPLFRRNSVYGGATVVKIKQLLDEGVPVIVTMSLSDAFFKPDTGGVIVAQEPPDPQRRHAVIAVGYGAKGENRMILIRNSWGKSWGIDGYAWIGEDYLKPRIHKIGEMKEDRTNVSANQNTTNMHFSVA